MPTKTKDNSRAGFTFEKIFQMIRLLHPNNIYPSLKVNKFSDIEIKDINKILNKEIKGLILDVDSTIAPDHHKILKENLEHLQKLHSQSIKIVIYSNMIYTDRYKNLEPYIKVLTNIPAKPSNQGFEQAVKELKLPKKNVAMIGDNFLTDGGAIKYGLTFIKVKPIKRKKESLTLSIELFFPRLFRDFYDLVAAIYEPFRKNKTKTLK